MKKIRIYLVTMIVIVFATACEKTEDSTINSIDGNYNGTITIESNLKSNANNNLVNFPANANVTMLGNMQIEVHCYGQDFDTTFMLNYFEHQDSVMVCLTGDDFEHMYGHRYGEGHMTGGMMGDMQNGETEWIHHMGDEHIDGDEHFGGFDVMKHSFGYNFKMADHNYQFQGTKE
ncbi:MAG: hypothetical protein GQ564_06105 [Bacteroidales bacterium]|nr:hypothetical protein [Bacteroidales bacterium]